MNSDKALEIFNRALEFDDPCRCQAYLHGACGDDLELLHHVQQLLRAHTEAEAAFPTEPGERTEFMPIAEGPGTVIGKYKLLQQIGEGGMGVVYMAEQHEPFDKRVALKIIKLGMDTKAVVARFEAERQALALMNHPNIAKVLDAGATDTGRPYFVMELVKGMPITEYCDKQKLNTKERLELFIPVCQAIQHAHQKGIIHRDIKPSNVLVALFDGRPVPMVIDFGIAKATNQRLTEQTVFTNLGQFIGTPAYMSPEQAEGSQLDIDTRSDIYSLGVLLYELLTGSTPFPEKRLRSAGFKEMQRIIIEEDPPRPSTRFSTMTDDERSKIGGTHGERPGRISLLLQRELDWIVMACLEKDRNRRYETANGLAMDIGRYLKGDAPEKGPRTWSYQLSKLARKHKKTFAMAAVIAVVLASAAVFSTIQWRKTQTAEEVATKRADKLAAINGFMNQVVGQGISTGLGWEGVRPGEEQKVTLTLKDALLRSSADLSETFKGQPEIEGELRLTIGRALDSLGYFEEAKEHFRRAQELLESAPGVGPTHTNALSARFWHGFRLAWGGGFTASTDEGRKLMEEAHVTALKNYGENSPIELELGLHLARAGANNGWFEQSEALLTRLATEVGSFAAPNTNYPPSLRMQVQGLLAYLRIQQRREAESLRLHEALIAELEKDRKTTNFSANDIQRFEFYGQLLEGWESVDKNPAQRIYHKALQISTNAVGYGFPTPQILGRLGDLSASQKDYPQALKCFQLALKGIGKNDTTSLFWYLGQAPLIHASQGDWTGTIEELRHQREDLQLQEGTHVAREILLNQLVGATNKANELAGLFFKELRTNPQMHFFSVFDATWPILALPNAPGREEARRQLIEKCINEQGDKGWFKGLRADDFLNGMLAYREGRNREAIQLLERVIKEVSDEISLTPIYMLAMACQRDPDRRNDAIPLLEKAEARLQQCLEVGRFSDLGSAGSVGVPRWDFVACGLALRNEAETLVYGAPQSHQLIRETLAEKRHAMDELMDLEAKATMEARLRHFTAARRLYAKATNHPAYKIAVEHNIGEFGFKVFAIDWALGDGDAHIGVLKSLHQGSSTNESKWLYQLSEIKWPLPPELEWRRRFSVDRQQLEADWADPQLREKMGPLRRRALGMCRFRDGQYQESLDVFKEDLAKSDLLAPVFARNFSAMAHWQLGHKDEARRLLKESDERYFQTVIKPGDGLYQPYYPMCIAMEQSIKEADNLIDPGVVNAPHVAALPPQGWAAR